MTVAVTVAAAAATSTSAQIIESYYRDGTRQVQIASAYHVIVSSSDAKFVSPGIPGTHKIIRYGMRASPVGKFFRKQSRMHVATTV